MSQVITISPRGELSGLQRKRGKGLDLRQFGHAEIERVSEIVWCADHQRWYVKILSLPTGWPLGAGTMTLSNLLWAEHVGSDMPAGTDQICPNESGLLRSVECLYFDDYDDAVAAEVKFLDSMRVQGLF